MQLHTITLSNDFAWSDEFAWSKWSEEREYSMGGALLRTVSEKLAGRPITLLSSDWMTRANFFAIQALADANPPAMTLTLWDGRAFEVVFDYSTGSPVTAVPVFDITDPDDSDLLGSIIIKLITVE